MKLWGSIATQDEHIVFWSFPIFFQVLHYTGNKLFELHQAFIKKYLELSFLTSTAAVDTNVKDTE